MIVHSAHSIVLFLASFDVVLLSEREKLFFKIDDFFLIDNLNQVLNEPT